MFPISTEAAAEGRGGAGRVLAGTLGILAVCVAPVLAAFAFFPEPLVRAVGGESYRAAAGLVLPLGIAMALMSFSNALLLYRLSTGRLRFYAFLPLLILLEAGALALFHGSPSEFAWTVAAMNGLFLLVAAGLSSRPPGTPTTAAPPPAPA
jgi:O-antigen/teichoic acid export membrane protein